MEDTELTSAESVAMNIVNGNLSYAREAILATNDPAFVLNVLAAMVTFSASSWPTALIRLQRLLQQD